MFILKNMVEKLKLAINIFLISLQLAFTLSYLALINYKTAFEEASKVVFPHSKYLMNSMMAEYGTSYFAFGIVALLAIGSLIKEQKITSRGKRIAINIAILVVILIAYCSVMLSLYGSTNGIT